MVAERGDTSPILVALLGAGESEIPVLAELHRNRRIEIVGIYDSDEHAVGLELAEILGLRHGSSSRLLEEIAACEQVVLPRDRNRFQEEIDFLRSRRTRLLTPTEALGMYTVDKMVEATSRPMPPVETEARVAHLEEALGWLGRALDREDLLRALLSIGIQAVDADNGSIQLVDPLTQELYVAYAEGLSDHTVRTSRQRLGEGVAGSVAATRRARLLHGNEYSPHHRERPDLLSGISVPLVAQDELLGVLNVSTELGSKRLEAGDLEIMNRVSERVSPVLRRLLEIQGLHERALVEDLRRELDRLLQMDFQLLERLSLARDLLQDLSSAHSASLVVLTPDGPAFRLLGGRDEDGNPRIAPDMDPSHGILGQVLLGHEPVIMEEKIRPAGQRKIHRHLTLYLPMGDPEVFCVFVGHFEGLAVLSHFQRNMDRVVEVMTPRLGAILAQEETGARMRRLRALASGLSALAAEPTMLRAETAAEVFTRQSDADTVAVWLTGNDEPTAVRRKGNESAAEYESLWPLVRERIDQKSPQRLRNVDLEGTALMSVLMIGSPGGPAIAALNRRPEGPLEELGFREEDVEAARLVLNSLAEVGGDAPAGRALALAASADEDEFVTNRAILKDAVERELQRAQRYHFGFSVTAFEVQVRESDWGRIGDALMHRVDSTSRGTDCVLWLSPARFAVLAPEEARGQKRLSKRFQALLREFLDEGLGEGRGSVRAATGTYPYDADTATSLIDHCLNQLDTPTD